jgi:hypothetical protein
MIEPKLYKDEMNIVLLQFIYSPQVCLMPWNSKKVGNGNTVTLKNRIFWAVMHYNSVGVY